MWRKFSKTSRHVCQPQSVKSRRERVLGRLTESWVDWKVMITLYTSELCYRDISSMMWSSVLVKEVYIPLSGEGYTTDPAEVASVQALKDCRWFEEVAGVHLILSCIYTRFFPTAETPVPAVVIATWGRTTCGEKSKRKMYQQLTQWSFIKYTDTVNSKPSRDIFFHW